MAQFCKTRNEHWNSANSQVFSPHYKDSYMNKVDLGTSPEILHCLHLSWFDTGLSPPYPYYCCIANEENA